jgi:hypothetical protein
VVDVDVDADVAEEEEAKRAMKTDDDLLASVVVGCGGRRTRRGVADIDKSRRAGPPKAMIRAVLHRQSMKERIVLRWMLDLERATPRVRPVDSTLVSPRIQISHHYKGCKKKVYEESNERGKKRAGK